MSPITPGAPPGQPVSFILLIKADQAEMPLREKSQEHIVVLNLEQALSEGF